MQVFISHAHPDRQLSAALRKALESLFNNIEVAFSSDKEEGGGIAHGEDWLHWIHSQVVGCSEALVLVTPQSLHKPWPMWEAGAVKGVALAVGDRVKGTKTPRPAPRVTPVRFRLGSEGIPGPFGTTQSIDGENAEDWRKLFLDWTQLYASHALPKPTRAKVLDGVIAELMTDLQAALRDTPPVMSEDRIEEWCRRLDSFRQDKRSSEVKHLHRWLRLALLGPQKDGGDPRPLDLRIHRRLAEMYFGNGDYEQAVHEWTLAEQIAPTDLFVLHGRGLALVRNRRFKDARSVLDRIASLDPEAFNRNQECIGLKTSCLRDEADDADARGHADDARSKRGELLAYYEEVLKVVVDSYYLADNAAQVALVLGDIERARALYRTALRIIDRTHERNVWSLATSAAARLVLGDEEDALGCLRAVRDLHPTEAQIESICGGLRRVGAGIKASQSRQSSWVGTLRGGATATAAESLAP